MYISLQCNLSASSAHHVNKLDSLDTARRSDRLVAEFKRHVNKPYVVWREAASPHHLRREHPRYANAFAKLTGELGHRVESETALVCGEPYKLFAEAVFFHRQYGLAVTAGPSLAASGDKILGRTNGWCCSTGAAPRPTI